ncbi:L,D-transpeptidase family protein [Herbidospora sp. RD11066]
MGVRQSLAVAAAMVTAGAVLAISPPAMAAPVAVTQTQATQTAADWVAPGKTLKFGQKGSVVKALQTRLKALGYMPGKIDGQYGGATQTAVWAFQKVNGITPTSTIVAKTWRALENPKLPKVLVPTGKPTRAEVNLSTQILVLYVKGQIKLISHISSGSGIPYVEYATWNGTRQKFTGDARTPTGTFKTTWRRDGWHKSYLGELYNPIFFNGGIAFHGALSVPLYPASHGCVRLPMHVAEVLPGLLGKGVPVIVRGKFQR